MCGDPDGSIADPHYVKEVWQAAELAAHWMAAAEWQDGWNPHTGDK